jgi:hypothetical protein
MIPTTSRQIGEVQKAFITLPYQWYRLHLDLVRSGLWKMLDPEIRRVQWEPWRCWEASGYGSNKLKQLMSWYLVEGRLSRTSTLITQALKRPEWSSVALPLGTYEAKPGSPLRYKLGQCMQSIIFKFHPDVGIIPRVVWRICEPTRRLLADFVILHNIFRYVKHTTDLPIHNVELDLNLVWLANFNAPLAEAWMPGLINEVPKYRKRFLVTKTPPQYRARKYAWDLVKGAKPMFDTWGHMLDKNDEHDWPNLRKELIV